MPPLEDGSDTDSDSDTGIPSLMMASDSDTDCIMDGEDNTNWFPECGYDSGSDETPKR